MNKHDESLALVKQWNVFLATVFPWNSEKIIVLLKRDLTVFYKKQVKQFNDQKKKMRKTPKRNNILYDFFLVKQRIANE